MKFVYGLENFHNHSQITFNIPCNNINGGVKNMAMYNETSGDDEIFGTEADDIIYGNGGNDTIYGGGGKDELYGGAGNDYIYYVGSHGRIDGMSGNDYIYAKKNTGGQIHIYGGTGTDTIVMDVSRSLAWSNRDGHHVFGGRLNDKFIFQDPTPGAGLIVGRIDDFDNSRDSIWIGDTKLDLYNLPDDVRVIERLGQQWLVISNEIVYALEGARKTIGNAEEIHFQSREFSLDLVRSLPSVQYIDQVNFVPYEIYRAYESSLRGVNAATETVYGSSRADLIYDGLAEANTLYGGDGNDIIDANGGHDLVYGEAGDDIIAGGQDMDTIYGGSGNDIIYGGSENDRLIGEFGNDILYGGTGNDRLDGNLGNDTLYGGAGNDRFYAHWGNDIIYGEDGDDMISGGAAKDIVWGGAGADTFKFDNGHLIKWGDLTGTEEERASMLDRIEDFVVGEDKVDLVDYAGVRSMEDLAMWETDVDGDRYFMLRVSSSDERMLIKVADDVTLEQIYSAENFLL